MATHKNPSQSNHRKPLLIYYIILPILLILISFLFTLTNYNFFFKNQFIRLIKSPLNSNTKNTQMKKSQYCVLWMAPFLSGGGYSSESWSYITAINENIDNPLFELTIEQHGDLESYEYWDGLPQYMKNMALKLHGRRCSMNETIVICHSEPGAWNPPLFETLPCPLSPLYGSYLAVVGRTMFETDRVVDEHVRRCNKMSYVWVPTDFHVGTFVRSGVDESKVVKVVQPVDVEFFDPDKCVSLDLTPLRKRVLGKEGLKGAKCVFSFLSIFKWEYRKGWDVLLKAYLEEFSEVDSVCLYLLTNPYHTDNDFTNKIVEFVEDAGFERPINGWAPVYVIDTHIAQVDLPRLYKSVDAFVLPSRGEGWGRPIVEAMAMSLPVIATNWSGPTEYLIEENGYPLPVDKLSQVTDGPFKGHMWAEPSVDKLKHLMRHVMSNVEEGRGKGRRAREDMIRNFSPKKVAGIVDDLITSIIREIS